MARPAKLLLSLGIVVFLSACDKPSPSRVSTGFNSEDPELPSRAPYLLPKCFDAEDDEDLEIVISAVGSVAGDSEACAVNPEGDNTDFSLTWSTSTVDSIPVRFAEVEVSAGPVYSGTDEDRIRLKSSFEAFQRALSALEEDPNNDCLNAGDTAVIRDRVASALPLRLDEILPFHYGFDPTNRVIDLQPGMRLRIEQGAFQFVSPGAPGNASNAYVGSGSSYLRVVRMPDGLLAFDSFLSSIETIKVDPEFQKGQGRTRMISGAMGLSADGVSRRYARLVYPSQYPAVKNSRAVDAANELPMRVGLLLANRLEELDQAGKDYLKDGSCAANDSNSVQCFYLSGRSFVIPELLVRIQGAEKYVSVGTTVRDAIDENSVIPISQIGNAGANAFNPMLQRWVQPVLCRDVAGYQATRVLFEMQSRVTPSGLSQWDMPLLKGDDIQW